MSALFIHAGDPGGAKKAAFVTCSLELAGDLGHVNCFKHAVDISDLSSMFCCHIASPFGHFSCE